LFEYAIDGMEARSRACPGEAEEAVAALAHQALSTTPTVKFLNFSLNAGPNSMPAGGLDDCAALELPYQAK
jgi:hypothetical protein